MKFSSALVAPGALLVGLAAGAEIKLDWKIKSYEDMTASVGDTVKFDWSDIHNVFIHPTGTCDAAGAIEVGTEATASHTFAEAGTVTFACDVFSGAHCQVGQIVTFTVSDAAAPVATTTEATAAAGTATAATAPAATATAATATAATTVAPGSSSDDGDGSGAPAATGVAAALAVVAAAAWAL